MVTEIGCGVVANWSATFFDEIEILSGLFSLNSNLDVMLSVENALKC